MTATPITAQSHRSVVVIVFAAVLDERAAPAGAGEHLPPMWHWLYFLEWPRHSELGLDGHPTSGHFYPPIPDRRRMFAGGRLRVHAPIEIGVEADRVRSLAGVNFKRGRTGEMAFVTVRSEISQSGGVRVVEDQDIVYRSGESPGRTALASIDTSGEPASRAEWRHRVDTDPRLLFRISALTANAHRIHYDAPYVAGVERYPGLVVHGPLLVLLMMELVRKRVAGQAIASIDYRLKRPVFAGERLLVVGNPDGQRGAVLGVHTAREDGHATAEVTFG
ncbi:MAG: FAS1-like dehydratase domain-containing protein [Sciscionella sp.]